MVKPALPRALFNKHRRRELPYRSQLQLHTYYLAAPQPPSLPSNIIHSRQQGIKLMPRAAVNCFYAVEAEKIFPPLLTAAVLPLNEILDKYGGNIAGPKSLSNPLLRSVTSDPTARSRWRPEIPRPLIISLGSKSGR